MYNLTKEEKYKMILNFILKELNDLSEEIQSSNCTLDYKLEHLRNKTDLLERLNQELKNHETPFDPDEIPF